MKAETNIQPWWSVAITTSDDNASDREFYVQAPDSKSAIFVALGAVDFTNDLGTIHNVHVGRKLDSPGPDMGAVGWYRVPN